MSLKTIVMVNTITNLSEARYCAGMGVQYLGFSPSSIDPKTYQDITSWLSGPTYFIDISALPIIPDLNEYPAEYILIAPHQIELLPRLPGRKIMIKTPFSEINISQKISPSYIIADRWTQSQVTQSQLSNLIVSIEESNQLEIFFNASVAGIILTGRVESKPGIMEYDHLSSILEKVEEEN